jgi:pimeloyl-ACP methyl ester carboxylesterase
MENTMPEARVRGVTLNYEVIGESGPWIAFTPGSRRAYGELLSLSREIARHGYRVLLHDRRNCGASEVKIEGIGSEHEIWADDLYELCRHLGATPLYVGGSSAGARLAVLFALRHPDALRGLLLWRVTGGQHAANRLAHEYYGSFMEIADKGGMAAVCESEHFAACIKARPANRDNLMAMDPAEFNRIMNMWRENFLAAATLPIVGATEAQLNAIAVPVCLIAGNDKVHTPATARKAASLIPNSELHDDVVEKRADDNLLDQWDQDAWRRVEGRIAQIFLAFIAKAEANRR